MFLILVLSLSVFAQILGTSMTFASVFSADQDLESAYEDLSLLPSVLKPVLGSCVVFSAKGTHVRDRPNFEVLVDHPPLV